MSGTKKKTESEVWQYFSRVLEDKNVAICTFCLCRIQHSGNTTNLWKHVRVKHRHKIASGSSGSARTALSSDCSGTSASSGTAGSLEPSASNSTENVDQDLHTNDELNPDSSLPNDHTMEESSSHNPKKRKTDKKIDDVFEEIKSYGEGGRKNAALTNALLYMIAADDLPLRTSERRGFQKFAQVAVPLYKPPSRRTVTRLIDAKYNTLSEKVKSDLKNIKNLSLTTDNWTDRNTNKSYLGLTVHYPEPSCIKSVKLGCFPLNESHTSDYLGTQLDNLCQEWNILRSSISAVISDNAANIVKAIHDTFGKSLHLPCLAHTIQLVPEIAMEKTPMLKEIVDKVKRIVTYFKQSNNAADELRRLQFAAGKTEGTLLKLIQQEDTRWNTTYYMIERFLLIASWLSSALFNLRGGPPMLLPEEIETLKEIMDLLKPIEQVTRELCDDDVTCSKSIPIVICLQAALEKKEPNSEIGIILQMNLLEEIKFRFDSLAEKYPILARATLLDPRFKKLHFSKSLTVSQTLAAVSAEMNRGRRPSQSNNAQANKNIEQNVDELWDHHDTRARSVPHPDEPGGVPSELRNYLSQSVIPRKEDPLKYWEEAKHAFPNVYRVSVKYLSIPATSVPCERLFSRAGLIDSDFRSRLNPERLSRLVFLSGVEEKDWGF